MKILSSEQIRAADQFTIANEPIASIDLMERASLAFVEEFKKKFKPDRNVHCFCGIGNNGGDGLAISRMLREKGWNVSTYVVGNPTKGSPDFVANKERLDSLRHIENASDFPQVDGCIVIDALFGSGLTRPLEGLARELVGYLNEQTGARVAVDIPSGLYADHPVQPDDQIFHADFTISFQVPKLAFFLPQNGSYVGEWKAVDIGLDLNFIEQRSTNYFYSTASDFEKLVPKREKFAHKSSIGRLEVVAGSKGKIGAAVLCAKAALRSGVGLLNVRLPKCGTSVMQSKVIEAMVIEDASEDFISLIPATEEVIAIGPGLGTEPSTKEALREFLNTRKQPVVLDADALNIVAEEKLFDLIPFDSILTPHPGEFRRLVGDWTNDFEKLELLRDFCKKHQLNVVLKGAYSAVCNSTGEVYFNPSGNPGMATAGSGDVLTGIVAALLAQGLEPFSSLRLGVYIHGLAGDMASEQHGELSLIAGDIIQHISNAFVKTCVSD